MSAPREPSLTDSEDAFLQAMGRAVVYISRVFEADFGAEHGMTMSEFSVLMPLSEAPAGRLRMGALAAATGLTSGRVTQVVQRLEARGLVERQPCATDRRGSDAVLTDAGLARLELTRPKRLASARRRVFDKLDGLDLDACTDVLTRICADR